MTIHQIRNATLVIQGGDQHILVDPMLASPGTLPRFLYGKDSQGRGTGIPRKNPLVPVPGAFESLKPRISAALITHCRKGHVDHLDSRGTAFLRAGNLPVYCSPRDAGFLAKRGLDCRMVGPKTMEDQAWFGGRIRTVPALHARGFMRFLMEHGVGYFISMPGEPSLYLMGDSVLTPRIRDFIREIQPDIIVAATGVARFDVGSPVLMDEQEILDLVRISRGTVVANHMDAIDHCRLSRSGLRRLLEDQGLEQRVRIPEDGEALAF